MRKRKEIGPVLGGGGAGYSTNAGSLPPSPARWLKTLVLVGFGACLGLRCPLTDAEESPTSSVVVLLSAGDTEWSLLRGFMTILQINSYKVLRAMSDIQ